MCIGCWAKVVGGGSGERGADDFSSPQVITIRIAASTKLLSVLEICGTANSIRFPSIIHVCSTVPRIRDHTGKPCVNLLHFFTVHKHEQ